MIIAKITSKITINNHFVGYALAEDGFLCSDIGKVAADDIESCESAQSVLKNIKPDIKTAVMETSHKKQPKGCFVIQNTIFLNTDSADTPRIGSRQICKGTLNMQFKINSILF